MPKIVAYRFVILLRSKGVFTIIINKPFCLLVGLVLLFSHPVFGKELVIGENNFTEVDLTGHIVTLVDTHAVWNWDQLPKDEKLWDRSIRADVLSGGLTGYAYWYKVELENFAADQYLVLSDPLIHEIDVYFVNDSGLIRHSRSGASLAFEKREVKVPNYYFLLPQGSYTCCIRLKKHDNFQFPLSIASFKYLTEKGHNKNMALGIYFGILFVLIFYNFFIYSYIKEKSYLYYIFYLCFLMFATGNLQGVSFEYLWPNRPYFNLFSPSYVAVLHTAIVLFVMSLLQTKIYLPKLTKGFYLFIGIFILNIIINLFSHTISIGIIQFTGFPLAVYLISTGIQSYRKGVQVAKFFLWVWSLYVLCFIIYLAQLNGFIVSNVFTRNSIFYGSALEAILFSLVLAYRLKMLRIEKEEAQQREIQLRIDNQQILEHQEETLQLKVDEAMVKLKRYQSDLVQSEKMNSLGRMAAGVAHEINNSIHVSGTSISIIDRNVGHIKKYFHQFETDLEFKNIRNGSEEVRAFGSEMNEIFDDLAVSISKAEVGIKRTAEITEGLKYFSKVGAKTAVISTDINRNISSMVLLQRSLLP